MKGKTWFLAFWGLVVGIIAGCGGSSGPATTSVTPNYVHLQSDAGDYIGQGRTYSYSQANSKITVSTSGNVISIGVAGNENWSGSFQVPGTVTQLQAGTYNNLQRYLSSASTQGGLDWYGEGRGSNTLTGWFVIDNITYTNGTLNAVDLHFELHSEGATAALHGQIHWSSADTTSPAGPVTPPPSNLWQAPAGATPATGNYVYLQSDAGDFIGQGLTYTYTPSDASITVAAALPLIPGGGLVTVGVSGSESWTGRFQAMNTLGQLVPGYYPNLQRYPFNNVTMGGLDWSGQGRGSNTLTGWFVVDNVTYTNGVLSLIDLRFEQHSEGASAALHGQIHWAAP